MNHRYKTRGTCSSRIDFELDGNRVHNIRFTGGCNGNTQGVSRLAEGRSVSEVINTLSGIKCGFRDTSCPDQLTKALKEALEQGK